MSTITDSRAQATVIGSRLYVAEYTERADNRGHRTWLAEISIDGQWIGSLVRDSFDEAKDDANFTIQRNAARFA